MLIKGQISQQALFMLKNNGENSLTITPLPLTSWTKFNRKPSQDSCLRAKIHPGSFQHHELVSKNCVLTRKTHQRFKHTGRQRCPYLQVILNTTPILPMSWTKFNRKPSQDSCLRAKIHPGSFQHHELVSKNCVLTRKKPDKTLIIVIITACVCVLAQCVQCSV